jgi:hypothetical protein
MRRFSRAAVFAAREASTRAAWSLGMRWCRVSKPLLALPHALASCPDDSDGLLGPQALPSGTGRIIISGRGAMADLKIEAEKDQASGRGMSRCIT